MPGPVDTYTGERSCAAHVSPVRAIRFWNHQISILMTTRSLGQYNELITQKTQFQVSSQHFPSPTKLSRFLNPFTVFPVKMLSFALTLVALFVTCEPYSNFAPHAHCSDLFAYSCARTDIFIHPRVRPTAYQCRYLGRRCTRPDNVGSSQGRAYRHVR